MSVTRKENLQTISPRRAATLLEYNTYAGQRTKRENKVKEYVQKILDGRFHVGSVALVHFKGETVLVDGQKQLTACIEADEPFKAVVTEYTLNGTSTWRDVANIYAQYNVDDSRKRSDIAHAKAAAMGWGEWPLELKRNLAAALDALKDIDLYCQNSAASGTVDQAGDDFGDNAKVCEWVASVFMGAPAKARKHLNRVAVIAAMIETYRACQGDAKRFWLQVRDGDELRKGSPVYDLREFLMSVSMYGNMKNPQQKKVAGRAAMFAKSINAWNAFREGRDTVLRYNSKQPLPKAI